jgi:DNA-binding response OmpR family regulator
MSHLLLIEDDLALRELYTLMLSHDGHSVVAAENGASGLQRLREQQPDAVLTDIMMPVLDGIGFIQSARDEFPDVPVIAMSGGTCSSDRLMEARDSGACWMLPKPFGMAELRRALQVATGGTTAELPACATA